MERRAAGPRPLWRTDRWVAVRSAKRDPDFRSNNRGSDAEFDLLVRNVYKVLLTRGLRGVYLHSTDSGTPNGSSSSGVH